MWAQQIFLAVIGLSAGVAAAGGLFSFIVELGVIADFADRTHTGDRVTFYEDCTALGGVLGNLVNMLAGYAYTNAPDAIMQAILTSLSACAMFPVYLVAMPASILSMVAAFRIKATN